MQLCARVLKSKKWLPDHVLGYFQLAQLWDNLVLHKGNRVTQDLIIWNIPLSVQLHLVHVWMFLLAEIHTYQANTHYTRVVCDKRYLQNFPFIFTFCNRSWNRNKNFKILAYFISPWQFWILSSSHSCLTLPPFQALDFKPCRNLPNLISSAFLQDSKENKEWVAFYCCTNLDFLCAPVIAKKDAFSSLGWRVENNEYSMQSRIRL